MMTKKQTFWTCDICGRQYEAEDSAIACETNYHKDISEAKIEHFGFSPPGTGLVQAHRYYPSSVTIRFSDKRHDYARYKLESIGPGGL